MRTLFQRLAGEQRFQSAPGREAGRCNHQVGADRRMAGFNPRPAVRPGDALDADEWCDRLQVSIRARP